jgi:hypothetical protein
MGIAHSVLIRIQISIFKQELSFFNREDILEINQSETRIACGGHVC